MNTDTESVLLDVLALMDDDDLDEAEWDDLLMMALHIAAESAEEADDETR